MRFELFTDRQFRSLPAGITPVNPPGLSPRALGTGASRSSTMTGRWQQAITQPHPGSVGQLQLACRALLAAVSCISPLPVMLDLQLFRAGPCAQGRGATRWTCAMTGRRLQAGLPLERTTHPSSVGQLRLACRALLAAATSYCHGPDYARRAFTQRTHAARMRQACARATGCRRYG